MVDFIAILHIVLKYIQPTFTEFPWWWKPLFLKRFTWYHLNLKFCVAAKQRSHSVSWPSPRHSGQYSDLENGWFFYCPFCF